MNSLSSLIEALRQDSLLFDRQHNNQWAAIQGINTLLEQVGTFVAPHGIVSDVVLCHRDDLNPQCSHSRVIAAALSVPDGLGAMVWADFTLGDSLLVADGRTPFVPYRGLPAVLKEYMEPHYPHLVVMLIDELVQHQQRSASGNGTSTSREQE